MPRALLTFTMLTVCLVLSTAASAKGHRSPSVKREFQLAKGFALDIPR